MPELIGHATASEEIAENRTSTHNRVSGSMKKRTVITTEKREVWVISEGGVRREIPDDQTEVSSYGSESATRPDADNPDPALSEEQEVENE